MEKYKWILEINRDKYKTPVLIKNDNDYLPQLKNLFNSFIEEIKAFETKDIVFTEIEEYSNNIIFALEQYYKGNITQAQEIVKHLLSDFQTAPAVTPVNECIDFYTSSDCEKVQFFRARLSENASPFEAKDMLHIPFNKRDIVKSERFSIPGLPCLYLANTSYCCWLEMGMPAEHRFNVSPFELDNKFKILNLTVSFGKLSYIIDELNNDSKTDQKYIVDLIKLFLLTLSTSFKVDLPNRNFKSEYILPQLIMLAAKDMKIDGISYLSKQVKDDLFASVSGINVVLFATYNGEETVSEICRYLRTADSFNFSVYKQLLPSLKCKEYTLSVALSPFVNNIGSMKRQIPYKETEFFEFDKYLFANADLKSIFE